MNMVSVSAAVCKPVVASFNPASLRNMDSLSLFRHHRNNKEKVVVIMGATGTGKSKLAIDLATQFPPAEIVNSDKMQVYEGLDITTNKVTEEERRGVLHHLLGTVNPNTNFTAQDFCDHATLAVGSILGRDGLPIIAGGSNSFLDALVNHHTEFRLRYECCFLWVDVSLPVLHSSLSARVDRMIHAGQVHEVRKSFQYHNDDYTVGYLITHLRAGYVLETCGSWHIESRSDKQIGSGTARVEQTGSFFPLVLEEGCGAPALDMVMLSLRGVQSNPLL
ncbi:Adenylate isopentenyltransferase 5, chloroplastic [Glycine soja]|nr:Adenylate isopentenyltransferase 5, chloroplastic [Glycine soja]